MSKVFFPSSPNRLAPRRSETILSRSCPENVMGSDCKSPSSSVPILNIRKSGSSRSRRRSRTSLSRENSGQSLSSSPLATSHPITASSAPTTTRSHSARSPPISGNKTSPDHLQELTWRMAQAIEALRIVGEAYNQEKTTVQVELLQFELIQIEAILTGEIDLDKFADRTNICLLGPKGHWQNYDECGSHYQSPDWRERIKS